MSIAVLNWEPGGIDSIYDSMILIKYSWTLQMRTIWDWQYLQLVIYQ